MKVSELIGKEVTIDDKDQYYYEFEIGIDYNLPTHGGIVVDASVGREKCITVLVNDMLYDFTDSELIYERGHRVSNIVDVWDWDDVVEDPRIHIHHWYIDIHEPYRVTEISKINTIKQALHDVGDDDEEEEYRIIDELMMLVVRSEEQRAKYVLTAYPEVHERFE